MTIKRITLYAYDNAGGGNVSASLLRTQPAAGFHADPMGMAATDLSASDPQVVTTTAISPRLVNAANHGLVVWIYISAPGSSSTG